MRIISTYVENTFSNNTKVSVNKDHLHLRGEYYFDVFYKVKDLGSSPLTWRIRFTVRTFSKYNRIISTYVENTRSTLWNWRETGDHLHLRGEYSEKVMGRINKRGSSPLTWRILFGDSSSSSTTEDHLHLRGEYKTYLPCYLTYIGSSPLTWRIH